MKKTPWFPASVKPVREGWYECYMAGLGVQMLRWTWIGWFNKKGWPTGFGAPGFKDSWRGLTEQAK